MVVRVRERSQVGTSRPRQDFEELRQLGIVPLARLNPSNERVTGPAVVQSEQASYDCQSPLQYYSGLLCNSIGHPHPWRREAERELV